MNSIAANAQRLAGTGAGALIGYLAVKYGLSNTTKGARLLGMLGGGVMGGLATDKILNTLDNSTPPLWTEDSIKPHYTPSSVAAGTAATGAGLVSAGRSYSRIHTPIEKMFMKIPPKRIQINPARKLAAITAAAAISVTIGGGVATAAGSLMRPKEGLIF